MFQTHNHIFPIISTYQICNILMLYFSFWFRSFVLTAPQQQQATPSISFFLSLPEFALSLSLFSSPKIARHDARCKLYYILTLVYIKVCKPSYFFLFCIQSFLHFFVLISTHLHFSSFLCDVGIMNADRHFFTTTLE
eukprot:UN04042